MKRYHSSSANLFLIEFIFSIIILAFCSTIFIRIFAVSWLNRKNARELNHVQEIVTNAAEIFEATSEDLDSFLSYMPNGTINDNSIVYYYSPAWAPSDKEYSAYELNLSFSFEEHKKTIHLLLTRTGNTKELLYDNNISFPIFVKGGTK